MQTEIIEKHLKRATNQSYWLGVLLGLLGGLAIGVAIGYGLASDNVVVIPLEQGVDV